MFYGACMSPTTMLLQGCLRDISAVKDLLQSAAGRLDRVHPPAMQLMLTCCAHSRGSYAHERSRVLEQCSNACTWMWTSVGLGVLQGFRQEAAAHLERVLHPAMLLT